MTDTALAMLMAGIAASHLRMHRRELRQRAAGSDREPFHRPARAKGQRASAVEGGGALARSDPVGPGRGNARARGCQEEHIGCAGREGGRPKTGGARWYGRGHRGSYRGGHGRDGHGGAGLRNGR